MSIRRTTPQSAIDNYLKQQAERLQRAIIRTLQHCGEACVNQARDSSSKTHDWTDQTGALRSSTGYVITVDGRIVVQSSFDVVKQGGNGAKAGLAYAQKVAREFPSGIVLIVVAGQDYAAHVANKGYDVLDSAELLADRIVPRLLKQLGL